MKTNQTKTGHRLLVAIVTILCITVVVSCTDQKRQIPDTEYTRMLGGLKHRIAKEQALSMLRTYDQNRDTLVRGGFRSDTLMMPIQETFGLNLIDSLLGQKGICGLRTYLAMDPVTKKLKIILIGVDKNGKDILQDERASGRMKFGDGEGSESLDVILEEGNRLP